MGVASTFDKAIRKDGDLLSVPAERRTLSGQEVNDKIEEIVVYQILLDGHILSSQRDEW